MPFSGHQTAISEDFYLRTAAHSEMRVNLLVTPLAIEYSNLILKVREAGMKIKPSCRYRCKPHFGGNTASLGETELLVAIKLPSQRALLPDSCSPGHATQSQSLPLPINL